MADGEDDTEKTELPLAFHITKRHSIEFSPKISIQSAAHPEPVLYTRKTEGEMRPWTQFAV